MRLMTTEKNRTGWVDSQAKVGDKVALLLGCTVPVVLRPRVGDGYEFVGDTIIYQLMEGEGLRDVNIEELDYIDLY